MKRNHTYLLLMLLAMLLTAGCEKEVHVDVAPSEQQLIVEASINQYSPILNYVFITHSVDYFKPDLTLGGATGADVSITEGRISGQDTIFDGARTSFYNIDAFPGADTLFKPYEEEIRDLRGVYLNPLFAGKENGIYRLNITMPDGKTVEGVTSIPKIVKLDTIKYENRGNPDDSGRYSAYTSVYWTDPAGQNNYRMAVKKGYYGGILLGWGAADSYRTFDDEFMSERQSSYSFFKPFKTGDTLSIYFTSIGRKEYLFWQSFGQAANNANPFATPVQLKSNIRGAVGTFTGYGVSFQQVIFKK